MSDLRLDQEQIRRITKSLKTLYMESLTLIKNRCYRRAYTKLDKFYSAYNLQDQISPYDRVIINKRIIYVLQKILSIYINKKRGNYNQKGELIIIRLQIALHEQYIIISQIMKTLNLPNDFRSLWSDHLDIQCSELQDPGITSWDIQEFFINVRTSVDLEEQLRHYFTSLLQSLLYISFWNKKTKDLSLYYLYANKACDLATLIQFKYIKQDKKLFYLGNLCTKCFINLSSCLFEINQTSKALETLDMKDQPIYQQVCQYLEDVNTPNKKKYKNSSNIMKKAIKTYLGFLLAKTLYHRELHQFQAAYQSLSLITFMVNNFLHTNNDEIKKYAQNVCFELAPEFEEQLIVLRDLEYIFQIQFEQDPFIQGLVLIHHDRKKIVDEKKDCLIGHFNADNYSKYNHKHDNLNQYYVMPGSTTSLPETNEIQLIVNKPTKVRANRTISLLNGTNSFHSKTNLDDRSKKDSTFADSRSRKTTIPFQSLKSSYSQTSLHKTQSPANSQNSIKLLTTTKYFLPMSKQPKIDVKEITDYMMNRDREKKVYKNTEQQEIYVKQQEKLDWQMNQIVNFDTNLRIKSLNSVKVTHESTLQKMVHQSLIKTDQSKNIVIVQQEHKQLIKDDCFDKKEFLFCKKMLKFKKSQHEMREPKQEHLAGEALKLIVNKDANTIEIVANKQSNVNKRLKKLNHSSQQTQDDDGTYYIESQLRADFGQLYQNANSTPLKRWRSIVLKHKDVFDLESFKIELRLQRQKDSGNTAIKGSKKDSKRVSQQISQDTEALIFQSQSRTKDLLKSVMKEYDSRKSDSDYNIEKKKSSLRIKVNVALFGETKSGLAQSTHGQSAAVKSQDFVDVVLKLGRGMKKILKLQATD